MKLNIDSYRQLCLPPALSTLGYSRRSSSQDTEKVHLPGRLYSLYSKREIIQTEQLLKEFESTPPLNIDHPKPLHILHPLLESSSIVFLPNAQPPGQMSVLSCRPSSWSSAKRLLSALQPSHLCRAEKELTFSALVLSTCFSPNL